MYANENEFLEALGSNNANNNTDLSLYSRFVGNWSFTMTTYDEEGKIEDTKEGEWLFHMSWMGMEFKMSSFVPKRRMDRGRYFIRRLWNNNTSSNDR